MKLHGQIIETMYRPQAQLSFTQALQVTAIVQLSELPAAVTQAQTHQNNVHAQ
jgi:hypothetical protein